MSTKFDLNTFKLDKAKSAVENDKTPGWVENGSEMTKVLYRSALQVRLDIIEKINAGVKLSVTDRRIVNKRLADMNGVDPSTITERRQSDLIEYIRNVNKELAELWSNKNKKKCRGVKALSKVELEKELVLLRKENKALEQKFCKESIEHALEQVFLQSQLELSQKITDLNQILEEKNETISQLRSKLRKYQIKPALDSK